MPCGVRYSDKVLNEISDDFLFENENANHQLVRSRALDEQSGGNQTARTSVLIELQKRSLGRMLGRLSEVSGSLGAAERDRFRKLVHDSKTLLPTNLRSTVNEPKAKRPTVRSAKAKKKLEAEARDLFNKSRSLIHKIERNLQIKTRVSCTIRAIAFLRLIVRISDHRRQSSVHQGVSLALLRSTEGWQSHLRRIDCESGVHRNCQPLCYGVGGRL